jgi:hypothetical protein
MQKTRRNAMKQFEVRFEVVGSGAGIVSEVVTASSDYSARRLIEAKFSGQQVRIIQVSTVR